MKLRELLQTLQEVQQGIGSSPVFICGGTPRDKYLGKLDNISDLDLTSGDKTIEYTAQEFAKELRKKYNITLKEQEDHSTIFIGNLKLDFSSNYNVPNIDAILGKMGINNPTDMQREIFSRDFTCNSLLLTLDLKTILDPTKRGFKDMQARQIKTCLAPEITLTSSRNRVVRSIYLACKLGFDVDKDIINFVRKHPDSVKISTPKSLAEKLNEAFSRDPDKASNLLTQMGLWNYVPITEVMYPYYTKRTKETL
jgi:poly(A) polymerase